MTKMGQGQRFKPDWTELALEAFGWQLAHSWSDLPCPAYSTLLIVPTFGAFWSLLMRSSWPPMLNMCAQDNDSYTQLINTCPLDLAAEHLPNTWHIFLGLPVTRAEHDLYTDRPTYFWMLQLRQDLHQIFCGISHGLMPEGFIALCSFLCKKMSIGKFKLQVSFSLGSDKNI